MGLIIVVYKFYCGVNIYYCSNNRDFVGDFEVVTTTELEKLVEIFESFPFVRTTW
ncbi:6.4-kDa protein [Tetterwort vein chlorosis virus]|uniref:6.4-kDa protein n=1 Tax=Tetterwort vein chlorosis virus TaxID=1712389 RepID=A0A0M4MWF0_9CLOS|nr:6.4-kDa protein [Tetterwort vein chlorosis virus]ALE18220.1 6.4-kDa protein [Tetterwort vein chlorosis virus]